jgi:PIN domain nuclease of toxin-antitoxin system
MRILLDTHVLIWFLEGNTSLQPKHRQVILNPSNQVFVSAVSLWEIAIKASLGKLRTSGSLTELIAQLEKQSIDILTISPGHVLQVSVLPFHHRDPFDRMLVAQAHVEFMSLISYDPSFGAYGIRLL